MSQCRRIQAPEKTDTWLTQGAATQQPGKGVDRSRMQDTRTAKPRISASVHVEWNYEGLEYYEVADPDWALDPNTLPSIDQLIECRGRNKYHGCSQEYSLHCILLSAVWRSVLPLKRRLPLVFIHRSHLATM